MSAVGLLGVWCACNVFLSGGEGCLLSRGFVVVFWGEGSDSDADGGCDVGNGKG